jgi:hypothetical protein
LRGGVLDPAVSMFAVPPAIASLTRVDTITTQRRTCPMPVLAPDSTRFATARVPVRDSAAHDAMPTLAPPCENPLRR